MKKKILLLLVVSLGLTLTLGISKTSHAQTRYKEEAVEQYGTITYERFRLLETLDGPESTAGAEAFNQTYFISNAYTRGISTYYLLKNNHQQTIGYVSASSVTLAGERPEGIKQPLIRSREILATEYPIYTSFSWRKSATATEDVEGKVKIKGAYHHFNGTVYYEIYDDEGKRLGLIDRRAMEASVEEEATESEELQDTSETVEENVEETKETEEESEVTTETRERQEPPMETMIHTPSIRDVFSQYFIGGAINGESTRVQPRTPTTIVTPQAFKGTSFNSKKEFVELLARDAKILGEQYDIYPSVMIAQAILESGYGESQLTREANNFYGMKFTRGVDEGKFERYDIYSDEFVNGQRVSLPASFRKYPTAKDSLEDYAKKIAHGVNWDKHFYRGAWRSVASTYQEATKSLTGKYATDPQYDQKLNQIIANWDLSQYDY